MTKLKDQDAAAAKAAPDKNTPLEELFSSL
jgi:hypothetical protein